MATTRKTFLNGDLGRMPALYASGRTPFARSSGALARYSAVDLARIAIAGVVQRSSVDPADVEYVTMATVIHNPSAPNLGREAMLGAGLRSSTPADTVSLACVSSNIAVGKICDQIALGRIELGIAGGAETMSDLPIRVSKALRGALIRLQKAKGLGDYARELSKLSPADLVPEVPTITEYSTGQTMGQSCERLAKRVGVTREGADEIAFRSHRNAIDAWEAGMYESTVLPVRVAPTFESVRRDDGPRADTSAEVLAGLRPVYDRKYGQVTAGNASGLSDGAAVVVLGALGSEKRLGLDPRACIIDTQVAASDPLEDTLVGPALAVPKLLERHGLSVEDIDVWEIHEAFASQVACVLALMQSDEFARQRLGLARGLPAIDPAKINAWGGSVALGHPFGATGARLVSTAVERLRVEKGRLAVVTACAAGGHGIATLIETTQAT